MTWLRRVLQRLGQSAKASERTPEQVELAKTRATHAAKLRWQDDVLEQYQQLDGLLHVTIRKPKR